MDRDLSCNKVNKTADLSFTAVDTGCDDALFLHSGVDHPAYFNSLTKLVCIKLHRSGQISIQ